MPDLLIDSDALTTSGFSGAQTTRTGAYDANGTGNNVIRATLQLVPLAVCGTGDQSHTGSYRVKARVYANDAVTRQTKLRLAWREGDGPLRANPWVSPVVSKAWTEVDLGTISIGEKLRGTQRWTGQIEAYSTFYAGAATLDIDYLLFMPTANGYGRARSRPLVQTPKTFSAYDAFGHTSGNLSGKVLPVGGTWSTSGSATDFTINTTNRRAQRATTSDASRRFAVAGTTNYTTICVEADVLWSGGTFANAGLLARWADASNFFELMVGGQVMYLTTWVAGIENQIAAANVAMVAGVQYRVRLLVDSSGGAFGWFGSPASLGDPVLSASSADLATGGALATGRVGLRDYHPGGQAITRAYDNFQAFVPETDAVMFSGRSAEIRHDAAIREDSTGTYWGDVPSYRGSRFYLQPAGDTGHVNRIAVKARRNDVESAADDQIADALTATVTYTPRYLVVPR